MNDADALPPRRAADFRGSQRIVSLVPSWTESLFALGLGDRVVGVTQWCVYPVDGVAGLPKLGGTKNPDVSAIIALCPDLVIANHEENMRRDVLRLEAAGVPVLVTDARTVRQGVAELRALADLGAGDAALARVLGPVEQALAEAERVLAALARPTPVFCPIWRDPWMSVGGGTYAGDLLRLCGGRNVFADHGDRRYPRVRLDEVVDAAPEVVLLPDEPYAFGPADVEALRALALPAGRNGRILCIDGTLVSWYGPRIARAIDRLRALLAPFPPVSSSSA